MVKKEIKIHCAEIEQDYLHVYLDNHNEYNDVCIKMNCGVDNLIVLNDKSLADLVDFLIEVQNNE